MPVTVGGRRSRDVLSFLQDPKPLVANYKQAATEYRKATEEYKTRKAEIEKELKQIKIDYADKEHSLALKTQEVENLRHYFTHHINEYKQRLQEILNDKEEFEEEKARFNQISAQKSSELQNRNTNAELRERQVSMRESEVEKNLAGIVPREDKVAHIEAYLNDVCYRLENLLRSK